MREDCLPEEVWEDVLKDVTECGYVLSRVVVIAEACDPETGETWFYAHADGRAKQWHVRGLLAHASAMEDAKEADN